MALGIPARGERAHPKFFWIGVLAVTIGVGLHLPMYIRSAAMNFHVAGMPIDTPMLLGMALIIGGTGAAWYGLLPTMRSQPSPGFLTAAIASLPKAEEEGTLSWVHWQLLLILTLAVIIDSMKPASLGFVLSLIHI